jgi:hypothetical protein
MSGYKIIYTILLLVLATTAFAQDKEFTSSPNRKGLHSLVAYFSGGVAFYASEAGAPEHLSPKLNNLNRIGSLRVMWHPDHLLKLGVETGYLTFYSYSFTDSSRNSGKVSLNAVPVLVEWSTSISKHLNVFVGSGIYMLTTNLDYKGKTSSRKLSIGWMAAGSYIAPVSEDVGLGAEFKWMHAAETSNGSISLQLQLVWKFLKL